VNGMLSAAASAMEGNLHGADRAFDGISTDTRRLTQGELFFALSGPNYDGADFVGKALGAGAAGAVVGSLVGEDIAQISVDDTRAALGRLARSWRESHELTVVGVTGSNGKTTLKELIAACLSSVAPTLATEGNLNNEIGVPLMLSRIDESHRYAVLEMGANHRGEIAYLTSLARPDIVVITNAGAAHLEGFGSVQGVAEGKGEILQGKPRPHVAVLNADDAYFDYWRSLAGGSRIRSFGVSEQADVRGGDVVVDKGVTRFVLRVGDAAVPVSLPLAGVHNVRNACAAAAIATELGVRLDDIAVALESVHPVGGRLEPIAGVKGAALYDDSYNANPVSVRAAAEFLVSLPGQSWLVLGDMLELGHDEQKIHREVGESARRIGVERLFATGELCRHTSEGFGDGAAWFATTDELAAAVAGQLSSDVNVLVKGSRAMRMERVVDALRAADAMRKKA
jgi:UDP-N-acetylmuramoyl-tripeptide--D-alanyl-D-alanine ligase